jgi:hypothetical protein
MAVEPSGKLRIHSFTGCVIVLDQYSISVYFTQENSTLEQLLVSPLVYKCPSQAELKNPHGPWTPLGAPSFALPWPSTFLPGPMVVMP